MTGGRVVVLGPTGKNFAAGMSGGIAYVLDEAHDLYTRLNKALVSTESVTSQTDIHELRSLIEAHAEATGSPKAKRILADFDSYLPQFKKIIPHDYAKITGFVAELTAQGASADEAEIEAFNLLRKEA
jgi:glutamate synthase (ferredoxin)